MAQARTRSLLACSTMMACMLMGPGCDKPTKLDLRDTEGRTFKATCEHSTCVLASSPQANPSTPQPEGAKASFVLHPASRLFAVCEVWMQGASLAIHPADCRALTCDVDGDCPHARNMSRGVCNHGLCIEPSLQISNEDAVLLCLAGSGPPKGTTKQVERYALGNACATPCNVPTVCRQP